MTHGRLTFMDKDQRGFTLIELMIAIVIAAIITGGITAAVMQVLTINSRASNHMVAVRQVQQAGKEVSKDTLQAQSVNATGSWGFPLILTWTEWGTNNTHTVDYTLEERPGGVVRLQRGHSVNGGNSTVTTVAEYIDGNIDPATTKAKTRCEWDAADRVLVFTVTATLGTESETRIYDIDQRVDP